MKNKLFFLVFFGMSIAYSVSANEDTDRSVDKIALQLNQDSILQLSKLKTNDKSLEQKKISLLIIDQLISQSEMLFRIVHGKLTIPRQQLLELLISKITNSLLRFPTTITADEKDFLLFKKAQAFEDLALQIDAQKYYALVFHGPLETAARLAHALIDVKNEKHLQALRTLLPVQTMTSDKRWSLIVFQIAWAYFQSGSQLNALREMKQLILALSNLNEQVLRDAAIHDLAYFYFFLHQTDLDPGVHVHLISIIKSLIPGPILGKTLLRYAKLLRTRGMSQALSEFETACSEQTPDIPEIIDIQLTSAEYFKNRSNWKEYVKKIATFDPSIPKIRTEIFSSIQFLEKQGLKSGADQYLVLLYPLLISVSATASKEAKENRNATDADTIASLRFNLGECYLRLTLFQKALEQFQQIDTLGLKQQSTMRSYFARYKILQSLNCVANPILSEVAKLSSCKEPLLRLAADLLDSRARKKEDLELLSEINLQALPFLNGEALSGRINTLFKLGLKEERFFFLASEILEKQENFEELIKFTKPHTATSMTANLRQTLTERNILAVSKTRTSQVLASTIEDVLSGQSWNLEFQLRLLSLKAQALEASADWDKAWSTWQLILKSADADAVASIAFKHAVVTTMGIRDRLIWISNFRCTSVFRELCDDIKFFTSDFRSSKNSSQEISRIFKRWKKADWLTRYYLGPYLGASLEALVLSTTLGLGKQKSVIQKVKGLVELDSQIRVFQLAAVSPQHYESLLDSLIKNYSILLVDKNPIITALRTELTAKLNTLKSQKNYRLIHPEIAITSRGLLGKWVESLESEEVRKSAKAALEQSDRLKLLVIFYTQKQNTIKEEEFVKSII